MNDLSLASHHRFATELLDSLSKTPSSDGLRIFQPNEERDDNAAAAMKAILRNRMEQGPDDKLRKIKDNTFGWRNGLFDSRNIADRDQVFWTNIRRYLAERLHNASKEKPCAYLLACSVRRKVSIRVWAIPEPIVWDWHQEKQSQRRAVGNSFEIHAAEQRIKDSPAGPDLTEFHREILLTPGELNLLELCRAMDDLVKKEKRDKKTLKSEPMIEDAERQLSEKGQFDPNGIPDARKRTFRSIAQRRGQKAFRDQLLMAYGSSCAISRCRIVQILEAAHIVPYRGPRTNHPGNGLLLRADLHTLFDLRLITIDSESMRVAISTLLHGSCYEEYNGSAINLPAKASLRPSRKALDEHRKSAEI